jgi:hypothetical protein
MPPWWLTSPRSPKRSFREEVYRETGEAEEIDDPTRIRG